MDFRIDFKVLVGTRGSGEEVCKQANMDVNKV